MEEKGAKTMIDNRESVLDTVKDWLAVYGKRVEMEEGKLSDMSEAFYCGLLNAMLGGDLKNMNREKPNFPAIDLGDDAPVGVDGVTVRLAVQITSTGTRQKVRHTLEEFFKNELHNRFDRLVVLVTGKAEAFKEEPELSVTFDFDTGRDVWSEKRLLERIRDLPDDRFEAVADYVKKRVTMPGRKPKTMNLPLQTAMAEGSFVGREAELEEIARRLRDGKSVVLSGLGGMGKTELAVKFGREYEKNGGGWVYFVPFRRDFYHTVVDELALGIPGLKEQGLNEEGVYRAAMEVLRGCGAGDLLIVDNADEGSITSLSRELSKLPMKALVTSRKDVAGAVKVESLPNGALYAVFEQNGVNIPRAEMDKLIDAVNAHTLTVDVMARTMGRGRRTATAAKLLAALKERDLSRGFTKVEIAYAGSPEQARINEHLKAVFRVAELEEESQVLLRCATLLPEGGMDDGLFLSPFIEEAGDWLDDLIEGGWLYMKDRLLRIHPVIRIVCIEVLEPTEEKCSRFLFGLSKQYDPKHYDRRQYRQLAEVFTTAVEWLEDTEGNWALRAGQFWEKLGEHVKALECNEGLVRKLEKIRPDSEAFARACNNLGGTYNDLGDHKRSLECYKQSLITLERVLPAAHRLLATINDNMGKTYGALGDYEQALTYQMKALEIREQGLDVERYDLATSYNNIGMTYSALGEHPKALEYKLKSMQICEEILDRDHPDLAVTYSNVGSTYVVLGDKEKGLKYKEKALMICEHALDADHPDLAASYNNVGYAYSALGDPQSALKYLLKAWDIWERVLPGNHPRLAVCCCNIACAYYDLGDIVKAAHNMRQAAEISNCSSLPENHTDRMNYNKWAEQFEEEVRQTQEWSKFLLEQMEE